METKERVFDNIKEAQEYITVCQGFIETRKWAIEKIQEIPNWHETQAHIVLKYQQDIRDLEERIKETEEEIKEMEADNNE